MTSPTLCLEGAPQDSIEIAIQPAHASITSIIDHNKASLLGQRRMASFRQVDS